MGDNTIRFDYYENTGFGGIVECKSELLTQRIMIKKEKCFTLKGYNIKIKFESLEDPETKTKQTTATGEPVDKTEDDSGIGIGAWIGIALVLAFCCIACAYLIVQKCCTDRSEAREEKK